MSTSLPETAPPPDFGQLVDALLDALDIPDGLTASARRKLLDANVASIDSLVFHARGYRDLHPDVLAHTVGQVRAAVEKNRGRIAEPDLARQAAKAEASERPVLGPFDADTLAAAIEVMQELVDDADEMDAHAEAAPIEISVAEERTVEAPAWRYLVQPHGHPEVYRGAIRGDAVGAVVAWAILHDARPLRDQVEVWATRIEAGGVKVGDPIEARNVLNLARVALAEAFQAKLDAELAETELPGTDVTRVHDAQGDDDDQRFAGGVVGDPRFLRDKTPADLVVAWEYDANLAQAEDPNGAFDTRGFARDLKEALTRVRIVPADAIVLDETSKATMLSLLDQARSMLWPNGVPERGRNLTQPYLAKLVGVVDCIRNIVDQAERGQG